MANQHALYRFYAADDQLLYVGITLDLPGRWKKHSDLKPWWTDVASTTVEHYPDRISALNAESAAIIAERPRYNVVHNRGRGEVESLVPQLDRLAPLQVGDWAALGLADGRCPVGGIMAIDEQWVSIRLKSFIDGCLTNHIEMVRWSQIERVELAYPEDSAKNHFGQPQMDDDHLGEFQSAWHRAHFGKDGRDPVDQARRDYRAEMQKYER